MVFLVPTLLRCCARRRLLCVLNATFSEPGNHYLPSSLSYLLLLLLLYSALCTTPEEQKGGINRAAPASITQGPFSHIPLGDLKWDFTVGWSLQH